MNTNKFKTNRKSTIWFQQLDRKWEKLPPMDEEIEVKTPTDPILGQDNSFDR